MTRPKFREMMTSALRWTWEDWTRLHTWAILVRCGEILGVCMHLLIMLIQGCVVTSGCSWLIRGASVSFKMLQRALLDGCGFCIYIFKGSLILRTISHNKHGLRSTKLGEKGCERHVLQRKQNYQMDLTLWITCRRRMFARFRKRLLQDIARIGKICESKWILK